MKTGQKVIATEIVRRPWTAFEVIAIGISLAIGWTLAVVFHLDRTAFRDATGCKITYISDHTVEYKSYDDQTCIFESLRQDLNNRTFVKADQEQNGQQ